MCTFFYIYTGETKNSLLSLKMIAEVAYKKSICISNFTYIWKRDEQLVLVRWCFEPSQPQRITSGLRERERRTMKMTNKA